MDLEKNKLLLITFGVASFHVLIAMFFVWYFHPFAAPKAAEKLVVKTVALNEEPVKRPVSPLPPPPPREIENPIPLQQEAELKIDPTPQAPEKTDAKPEEEIKKEDPSPLPVPSPKPLPSEEKKPLPKKPAQKKEVKKTPPKKDPPKKDPPKKDPPKKAASKTPKEENKTLKPPIEKKPELTEKEKMLQKAKENLAMLEGVKKNIVSASSRKEALSLNDLSELKYLSIDRQETASAADAGYYGTLAARLKESLKLPENGDVSLKLTLDRNGHVSALEIVASPSEKNRKYVGAFLKTMKFPPFGLGFSGESQHTFTIKLASDP